MITNKFIYGDYTYAYGLIRQERKTLSLTVYPDKKIVLKCPPAAKQDRIHEFLKRKYSWLNKQIRFFDRVKRPAGKKEYISGESFLYLGRQYKLMVRPGPENNVTLTKDKLWVFTAPNGPIGKQSQKLLEVWYQQRAAKVLKERFEAVLAVFKCPDAPRLKIRTMKTRWGSCSKKGAITLNPKLIQTPSYCIDYVIMHELCHLIEHNHSPQYYKLLDRMMPDWQSRKKRLETIIT